MLTECKSPAVSIGSGRSHRWMIDRERPQTRACRRYTLQGTLAGCGDFHYPSFPGHPGRMDVLYMYVSVELMAEVVLSCSWEKRRKGTIQGEQVFSSPNSTSTIAIQINHLVYIYYTYMEIHISIY